MLLRYLIYLIMRYFSVYYELTEVHSYRDIQNDSFIGKNG